MATDHENLQRLIRVAGQAAKSDSCVLQVAPLGQTIAAGETEDLVVAAHCCERAMEYGQPWVVTDRLSDPVLAEGALLSEVRAGFAVPVIGRGGKVLGALAFQYHRPFTPTEADMERNQLYAKLVGFALQDWERFAGRPVESLSEVSV